MKTSVTKMMMSFALMGCLIIGASDASAQGRSRSQGGSSNSRSQTAAVSRSSNTTRPTVSRTTGTTNQTTSRSSARPQVERSTQHSSASVSHSTAAPQVNRGSSSSSRGAVTRGVSSDNKGSAITPRSIDKNSRVSGRDASTGSRTVSPAVSPTVTSNSHGDIRGGSRPGNDKGGKPGGGSGRGNYDNDHNKGGKPSGGNGRGNYDNDHNKGRKPSGGNGRGNYDNDHNKGGKPGGGNRHGNNGDDRGKWGRNHGYNNNHRYDYNGHHYRDQFSWNYAHHSWSRACPPPARSWRPAPLIWTRPVIPVGWHPYAGAPVIDRILGLTFGSLFEASLDYLYYSGYYIDGYADGIIYLRDVPMLNLYWHDVMLNYELNRLANAQFVYHSSYYDRARFDRVYRSLCRVYGPPVYEDGMTISWYGGNRTGWVTLSMNDSYGNYYTTISIGY